VSCTPSIVDYLVGQLGPEVSARAMFGEFGLYRSGVLIGLVCDDELFLKSTVAGGTLVGADAELSPPYPGAKPALRVHQARWDDEDFMARLAQVTAAELGRQPRRRSSRPKKRRGR
jgi:DNA transformation protein and related proteins